MAEVRKFLTLSTAHTPVGPWWQDTNACTSVLDRDGEDFGVWLWVPDDPRASAAAMGEEDAPAEWLLAIQLFARELGCDYVLFDPDGPEEDGLDLFCWDCGGSRWNVAGCRSCCRDSGRPCDRDKNGEGFHAEAQS